MAAMHMASDELKEAWDLSLLRYSRVEEDCRVLSRALHITPDVDVVLSITSAGDNVLNLLLDRPKKIVAVDISFAQSSLLELKLTAISHLNYQDFLVLLGEKESDTEKRLQLYQAIRQHLRQYARDYWDSHTDLITRGLRDCGRLQEYCYKRSAIPFTRAIDPDLLKQFLESSSVEEQRNLFEQFPLQKVQAIMRDLVLEQTSGRSSVQLKYVTRTSDEMVELVWKRFCFASKCVPVKDNFYYHLLVRGERSTSSPTPDYLLPPFLTETGFSKLKDLVDRVEVRTEGIQDYLYSSSAKFHKMNLSDMLDYMSKQDCDDLFSLLSDKTEDGGVVVYWNLFSDQYPSETKQALQFQKDVSLELHRTDRSSIFYELCVLKKVA